ncbi:MAG TPA: alpha/beta fold hydrolase [Acidimicrobiales bacterium]|nr:alpha/beta fold hydrolase [Acidimicrobiales bacterium]
MSERVASLRSLVLIRPELEPIRLDGSVEDAVLLTADGLHLSARWWRRPERARAAVVLVHGFGASKEDGGIRALASDLHGAGFDVLTYDARGHGASEGNCTVGGEERLDVAAAAALAAEGGQPVVLVGVSMGAIAVFCHVASMADEARPAPAASLAASPVSPASPPVGGGGTPIAGIVAVSAPARWRMSPSLVGLAIVALTRTKLGRWVMLHRLGVRINTGWVLPDPPLSAISHMGVPVALVHGRRDRLIRAAEARLLFDGAAEPRRLDVVARMGHGIDDAARGAVVEAIDWVMDVPSGEVPAANG